MNAHHFSLLVLNQIPDQSECFYIVIPISLIFPNASLKDCELKESYSPSTVNDKKHVLLETFISVSSMCLYVLFFSAIIPQTQYVSSSMTAISTQTVLEPKRLWGQRSCTKRTEGFTVCMFTEVTSIHIAFHLNLGLMQHVLVCLYSM